MGEVYRARDSRLDRSVAIKVICLASSDADRLRRFELEARSIAALSHPNILAIFDVGTHDDTPYLVTELLEGETLRERLNKGPLPVRKAVQIGSQIAHALAAAHERGIVHRDLKPENIFLTKDGHTKLLDFGLAKMEAAASAAGPDSATRLSLATEPGVVMGTVGYMSPEQVRGEVADHRCDIFSFGAVLYEMLDGKRAFTGDSSVEMMTAILKSEPPEINPAAKIPPGLDRIVRHCLEKNPDDRFQSARDLTFALGALSGSDAAVALSAVRPQRRDNRRLLWIMAGIAVLAVSAAIYFASRSTATVGRMEFAIPVPGEVSHLALSPDGSMLAYVSPDAETGVGIIYVQRIGDSTSIRLDGTEDASYPFWSPDNNYVAFFAGGRLKKVAVAGGVPQVLARVLSPRGGSWGKKNVIIYTPDAGSPIWRVDADGTGAAPLTGTIKVGLEASHRWPVFLPDGEHFLFWAGDFSDRPDDHTSGIYVSSLAAKTKDLLVLAHSNAGYANDRLFYLNEKSELVSVSVELPGGSVQGRPKLEATQIGYHPSTYRAAFSVGQNGTLVFSSGSGAPNSQLTWYDRSGKELGRVGEVAILSNPNLSVDGKRTSFDLANPRTKNVDVWTIDLERGTSARFTFDPAEETIGVWSRDGKWIAFRSSADNMQGIHLKNSNGLEQDKLLALRPNGSYDLLPNSWSVDDSQLLATAQNTGGGSQLVLVNVKDGSVTPFLPSKNNQRSGQISPDNKWVAYETDETGDWEVYVTTYPVPGGKLQVSRNGGKQPRWRADGKEIFYIDASGKLVAVPITVEGSLSTGKPELLYAIDTRPPLSSTDLFMYDVSPDGKRFLVNRYQNPAHVPPLNIILNSTSER